VEGKGRVYGLYYADSSADFRDGEEGDLGNTDVEIRFVRDAIWETKKQHFYSVVFWHRIAFSGLSKRLLHSFFRRRRPQQIFQAILDQLSLNSPIFSESNRL